MIWVPFDDALAPAWDAFVASTPGGRAVHFSGFKGAVEAVYRLEPFYRACRVASGRVRAVFPGFFHPSRIYGRKIVSQPSPKPDEAPRETTDPAASQTPPPALPAAPTDPPVPPTVPRTPAESAGAGGPGEKVKAPAARPAPPVDDEPLPAVDGG